MHRRFSVGFGLCALLLGTQVLAQVTFYEGDGFRGRAFTTRASVNNFARIGFNDRASSVVVDGGRWEACEDADFRGRCVVLRVGSYESLGRMGLNDRISSVRRVDDRRHYSNESPDPLPAPTYEYRQRPDERIFEVPVESVHAVVGPDQQRCWVEREQVAGAGRDGPNVGGALVGALIGGVIGHQIGGGHGRDIAIAGGAVAGGVIGSQAGASHDGAYGRDVQRCETVADTTPAYWDVSYDFRGVEHHVQMTAAPGRTLYVNADGVPRQ